jgi:hypothetical protein
MTTWPEAKHRTGISKIVLDGMDGVLDENPWFTDAMEQRADAVAENIRAAGYVRLEPTPDAVRRLGDIIHAAILRNVVPPDHTVPWDAIARETIQRLIEQGDAT